MYALPEPGRVRPTVCAKEDTENRASVKERGRGRGIERESEGERERERKREREYV